MDRNLALECVRVTEAAALSASRWMGRGNNDAADQAAVDAMRRTLNMLHLKGTIVIGEGERDEAPMLYIGEKVGIAGDDDKAPKVDIALDPLEGTTITATGGNNALAVIAIADEGNFLHAPDTYMEKIAVGRDARGVIDISKSPTWNIKEIAKAKDVSIQDLTVIILDRERHKELIKEVRETGARVKLICDGDVAAAISTCFPDRGVDILIGSGGAPEGVLAAAALRCTGGDMQGKLIFRSNDEINRARKMGITDTNKIYNLNELARGNVMFAATGVTNGDFLKGVRYSKGRVYTHSMVMRSETGTIRYIEAEHNLRIKPLEF